ncbi:MAG: hypothetical protein KGJ55_02580 [Gammaproteobacteria bacterium]|nr:hypothetical protein [Gammaproteobacteria bacterium]
MRTLLAGLLGLSLISVARADTLRLPAVPGTSAVATPELPQRGATMRTVEQRFGAPVKRHPPAGGDSPKHPPITRWDYTQFSVFFERNRVLDSVIPGQPPPISHRNQLQPAD